MGNCGRHHWVSSESCSHATLCISLCGCAPLCSGCLTLAIIIFAAMRYSGDARAAHLAKLPPVEALETALAAYDEDEDIDPELLTH